MLISLNWLKEFISLSNISPEEIKDKLTSHTVEVEGIVNQKDQFKNVVIAEITEIKKHPQADKLQIAIVKTDSEDNIKVVCGAPNIAVGQLVPLAKIGAILPNGLEIKKTEIRGEESNGMLCAEDELGLGNNHDGIMILDKKAKLGQNIAEYLELNETILEVDNKSISNRPDLWSHYGIARELGVIFNKKLKEYNPSEIKIKKNKSEKEKENVKVEVRVKNLCKKYLALKIENIKVEESPDWLKNKLSAIGAKPINNIVDATNYVMFESGQPLHAFDARDIKKIIVRKAEKNETLKTLDDQEKKLIEDDLVIANDKEIIAIAGVIGGKNSQINNTSTSIIIESANFDAVSVRKTAQRLLSRTDAAIRFEKGLDPNLCQLALNRVVEIIKKIQPKVALDYKVVDENNFKNEEKTISLNLSWAEKVIGQKIDDKKIINILESLGLIIKNTKDSENIEVGIPTWRQKDLQIKEDLIEEIIRVYGYNNIDTIMPESPITPPEKDKELDLVRKIKKVLSLGYKMNETYNYSFVNEEQLLKLNLEPKTYIKLANPLSSQHTLLRQTLTTNLLTNIKTNQAKYDPIALFEIGNIFLNVAGGPNKDNEKTESLPYQEKRLGLIIAQNKGETFNSLKNIVFNSLNEISAGSEVEFLPTETIIEWADKEEKCLIFLNQKEVGFLAKINSEILSKNGIKKEVSSLEITLKNLLTAISSHKGQEYQAIVKFPPIKRDLAFVIDKKIFYNDIRREIKDFHPLIKEVELFDVYSGKNLEDNKKSLAFHISYQSEEKTLTSQEIDEVQERLVKNLEEKFSAHLRDF
jgi:phenylalanyl-tRNA synthetase beta chain